MRSSSLELGGPRGLTLTVTPFTASLTFESSPWPAVMPALFIEFTLSSAATPLVHMVRVQGGVVVNS